MGSRANLAVRQNGGWTHCGSNGMGYSLDAWLGLGPGPALAVARFFTAWDRHQWQSESVCEAGALIDLDDQDLLIFLNAEYGDRLARLEGYRRTWPGWTIRWACNGIADIADALGLDSTVLDRDPWDNTDLFQWGRSGADEPQDLSYVVTLGDTAHGLDGWAAEPWQIGPGLLDQLAGLPRLSTWPEVPRGGLHLDPATRHATAWSIMPVLGLPDRFADRWPGWTLDFCQDRYQEQERRCAGAFRFPDPAPAVERGAFNFAERVMDHWVGATAECRDGWLKRHENSDLLYGMGDAGLTIADLQESVDLLLGPERDRSDSLDVAAYARRYYSA